MLAGRPPFITPNFMGVLTKHITEAPPPLSAELSVPPALEAVMMRVLAKEPNARQTDATELSRELRAAEEEARRRTTETPTTYRRRKKLKGAEPDTSFYVQNAACMIGRQTLDLEVDPPPDTVVEIDTTNESLSEFPIYAALSVPEIWLYDGNKMLFYQLANQQYAEVPHSLAFPLLAAEALTEFLERNRTEGQTAALRAFRQWAQAPAANIKE